MKQSKKAELMQEFFLNNEFDLQKDIFNVEFEMYRRHLKDHNIDTIEDALKNAESLFKKSMDDIRLIDINTITKKDIENNSKNRAITLSIWDEIKNTYSIKDFMQNIHPVERLKRKLVLFSQEDFEEQFKTIIRKALTHRLPIRAKLLERYLDETVEALTMPKNEKTKKGYIDIVEEDINGNKEHFRLLDDGYLIKPYTTTSFLQMTNEELLRCIEDLSHKTGHNYKDTRKYEIAYEEAAKRGLVKRIPF